MTCECPIGTFCGSLFALIRAKGQALSQVSTHGHSCRAAGLVYVGYGSGAARNSGYERKQIGRIARIPTVKGALAPAYAYRN
jgi:hypothetical protein